MCKFYSFTDSYDVKKNQGENRCGAFVIAYWLGLNDKSSVEAKIVNYEKGKNGNECEKIIDEIYNSDIRFTTEEIKTINEKISEDLELNINYTNPIKMCDYLKKRLEIEINIEYLDGLEMSEVFKVFEDKKGSFISKQNFNKMGDDEKIIVAVAKDGNIANHYIFAYKDGNEIKIMDPDSNSGEYIMTTKIEELSRENNSISVNSEKLNSYNFGGFIIRKKTE